MTKICAVAVHPDDGKKAVQLGGADMIEFRLDLFPSLPADFSFFSQNVPTIATFRGCHDSEIFDLAFEAGAEYADIEFDSPLRDEYPASHTICSVHDFETTPSVDIILDTFADLAESGIPKAAYAVSSLHDLMTIGYAAEMLRSRKNPFILIGMGKKGQITRVRAQHLGSYLTYVSLGVSAAPGEFTLEQTRHMTLSPLVTGIIGSRQAVEKSRSPRIHASAFASAGISGVYLPFAVEKNELSLVRPVMKMYRIIGLNVTMPYKEEMVSELNTLSPDASMITAVNTITADGTGYNTDIHGVSVLLSPYRKQRVLILGTGGAAKAACASLISSGADITIANRTEEHARDLASAFGVAYSSLHDLTASYDLVLAATPEFPVPPAQILSRTTVAVDMNYPDSVFLQDARNLGCIAVSGKEMLIAQASASFELWTGIKADVEAMNRGYDT